MKTTLIHLLTTLLLGTLLPPASKPRVAVIPNKATYKERGLTYTDAGMQAGNMYGAVGMLVGAAMRSVTLSHNAAFSKVWVNSGKNAPGIIVDEFQKELVRNGYILDPAAPNKIKIDPGVGMTTCDRPNARASRKQYFALCMPFIWAQTSAGKTFIPGIMLSSTSQTSFTFETVTVESYEAALRQAASLAAKKAIYGPRALTPATTSTATPAH
jgi:hypothetical protein